MKIECFLLEKGTDRVRLSLGVYDAKSLWDALAMAQRRHRKMLDKLETNAFEVVAESAAQDRVLPKTKRLVDTTPDIFERDA